MDVREDITADNITATIRPRAATGSRLSTSSGKAMLVQPVDEPQCSIHSSGSAQATKSGGINTEQMVPLPFRSPSHFNGT